MKMRFILAVIVLTSFLLLTFTPFTTYSQSQELNFTTTPANIISSKASIDLPGLTNNPLAIIVATPLGDTQLLNSHPLGAWYYANKWNLFNTDHAVMPPGAKYKIEFFLKPGPNQFLHVVTQQNLGAEGSYIDHPSLNGNPNAQIKILQNHAPEVRSPNNLNRFEAKASYSTAAGRWFIANVNGEAIGRGAAYNIVVGSGSTVGANTNPGVNPPGQNPTIPTNPNPTIPTNTNPTIPPNPNPGTGVSTNPPANGPAPVIGPVGGPVPPQRQPGPPPGSDWTLHQEELQPTIPANSDIILFIHGMDSRAEEADDITRALFEFKKNNPTSPGGPPAQPPTAPSTPDPQMVAVLNQLLQKYKGCILEKYETKIDMISRSLSPNLSELSNTAGLQDRDNVGCVDGSICSLSSRRASFAALQAQANRGIAKDFEKNLEKAVPKDCFNCQKHVEWHTKHVHCTMDVGGNNGVFKGPAFESCKAGVDLNQLASIIINDIHNIVVNITGVVPEADVTGGASVATNRSTVKFEDCSDPSKGCPEQCKFQDIFAGGQRIAVLPGEHQTERLYFSPLVPSQLLDAEVPFGKQINVPAAHNIGTNEGRLRRELRDAAAAGDPLQSLRQAAYQTAGGNSEMGQAFADLSVTGRRAFRKFKEAPPSESFCQSVVSQRPGHLSENGVLDSCHKALDRAYKVANFLRTGQRGDTPAAKARKIATRNELGWIAVSGEDDQPHRPVNVPSSDSPQYDFDVVVDAPLAARSQKSVTVRTRYVVAQSPTVGSSGRPLVVISLDLPTSGYTENIDYDFVSPLAAIGGPKWTPLPVPIVIPPEIMYLVPGAPVLPPGIVPGIVIPPGTPLPDFQATGKTPLLDFIENFIVRFAETLDQKVPVKNNFRAVMGGSLGGNMTFRLGRRPGVPWLPNFIVWSPASIWTSMGEGSDILKHIGPRKAWEGANQTKQFPTANDRKAFFGSWDDVILPVLIPMAQSDTWTSDYYSCKKSTVAAARLDRHETYDPLFLAWHWRLGAEQLLYSHQTIDPTTNRPRFMANQKPMLLACGSEDHVKFNDICPATKRTAPLMTLTPGKALFLDKTGHSLDNERPEFWARQVMEFLKLK